MANCIKHTGIIEQIEGNHCKVRIQQTSACASCSIKSHCTTADSKEKIIDAYVLNAETYTIGEEVVVAGQMATGYKAVFLAFVVPVILLIAALMVTILMSGNELLGIAVSLGLVAVYYGTLSLFKDKLQKQFSFWVEKN